MPELMGLLEGALYAKEDKGLSAQDIKGALTAALAPSLPQLNKVLLIPPDFTRVYSNAGFITQVLYRLLAPTCQVDIMPALGTHVPVSQAQWEVMFGDIPYSRMLLHNWRTEVVDIGQVPADFVREISEGRMDMPITVEINKRLLDTSYDLILSIGQVVPHEVVGMANQSKNIFVGLGGSRIINISHMLGAVYGMERVMGRDRTPVRQVLDYASAHFIKDMPLQYILTVTDAPGGEIRTQGLFMGRDRRWFEGAVALSQQKNITHLNQPLQKVVVYLDEQEFGSTWLGNKAIYRTRMAIADKGELIVLAPGVNKFGEDKAVDALIRKHGYRGIESVLKMTEESMALRENLSAAAHLIHGSSEGRFRITYAARLLSRAEIEGVGYRYLDYEEAIRRYPVDQLKEGFNRLADGEEIYYISKPALGLWVTKGSLEA
ncbi:MAG: DUF2088 domain-containing protein [Clostridiales bacterium]|nr:DUF2088 domain-containing protein [Clostridiales bacterium]